MTRDRDKAVKANLDVWDSVVDAHAASDMYDLEGFLAGANHLGQLERQEVGDVTNKRLLHLLCHFGLDTLSWARLGAKTTGLDISPKAIAKAREIAAASNLDARFVQSDIAHAREAVEGPFDIVFMSWGAICWIPDIERLFQDVAGLLAPGGFYYLLDAHPLTNAIDETWTPERGAPAFPAPYQSSATAVAWDWTDYADESFDARGKQSFEWPHSNAQVITALAKAGLRIEFLHDQPPTPQLFGQSGKAVSEKEEGRRSPERRPPISPSRNWLTGHPQADGRRR